MKTLTFLMASAVLVGGASVAGAQEPRNPGRGSEETPPAPPPYAQPSGSVAPGSRRCVIRYGSIICDGAHPDYEARRQQQQAEDALRKRDRQREQRDAAARRARGQGANYLSHCSNDRGLEITRFFNPRCRR